MSNVILDIELNNSESLSKILHLKLQEAPEAWMMIQGSHSTTTLGTAQREQVIDFAVKIKGFNARISRVELRSNDGVDLEAIPTDKRGNNSSTLDEDVIKRSCQAVVDLANKGCYKGIIVEKDTLDIDHTSLQKTLRRVANHVIYGGNINVTLHDTTSLTTYHNKSLQKEEKNIYMKAIWIFDWPGLEHGSNSSSNMSNSGQPRRQETWSGRLKAAMVDNEQGWIGKDDPIPGGIQFTRALKKFDLVYDRTEDSVHYENGVRKGSSGTMRFRWWGCYE